MDRRVEVRHLLWLVIAAIGLFALGWLALSSVEPELPNPRTMQFVPDADGGTVIH